MGETLPSNTGGVGLSPGQRTKGSHVSGPKPPKNLKQKQCCNKFNRGFKNSPYEKKNLKKGKVNPAC